MNGGLEGFHGLSKAPRIEFAKHGSEKKLKSYFNLYTTRHRATSFPDKSDTSCLSSSFSSSGRKLKLLGNGQNYITKYQIESECYLGPGTYDVPSTIGNNQINSRNSDSIGYIIQSTYHSNHEKPWKENAYDRLPNVSRTHQRKQRVNQEDVAAVRMLPKLA